jgi:hypothetical protein
MMPMVCQGLLHGSTCPMRWRCPEKSLGFYEKGSTAERIADTPRDMPPTNGYCLVVSEAQGRALD